MALPSKTAVRGDVVTFLTVFTGKTPAQLHDSGELKTTLQLTPKRLNALALSLRGYVKQHNESATLAAKEIKKKKLTVGQLVELVYQRVHDERTPNA